MLSCNLEPDTTLHTYRKIVVSADLDPDLFKLDIITHHDNVDGVDHVDQHRVVGCVFFNVALFNKWYKKAFMGPFGFSFLQAFTTCNLAVDRNYRPRRCGESKFKKSLK